MTLTTYTQFKKKFNFDRYLSKSQSDAVDTYVRAKVIEKKNWSEIDESTTYLLRLQVGFESYFFALLFEICEESLLRKKLGAPAFVLGMRPSFVNIRAKSVPIDGN